MKIDRTVLRAALAIIEKDALIEPTSIYGVQNMMKCFCGETVLIMRVIPESPWNLNQLMEGICLEGLEEEVELIVCDIEEVTTISEEGVSQIGYVLHSNRCARADEYLQDLLQAPTVEKKSTGEVFRAVKAGDTVIGWVNVKTGEIIDESPF